MALGGLLVSLKERKQPLLLRVNMSMSIHGQSDFYGNIPGGGWQLFFDGSQT